MSTDCKLCDEWRFRNKAKPNNSDWPLQLLSLRYSFSATEECQVSKAVIICYTSSNSAPLKVESGLHVMAICENWTPWHSAHWCDLKARRSLGCRLFNSSTLQAEKWRPNKHMARLQRVGSFLPGFHYGQCWTPRET